MSRENYTQIAFAFRDAAHNAAFGVSEMVVTQVETHMQLGEAYTVSFELYTKRPDLDYTAFVGLLVRLTLHYRQGDQPSYIHGLVRSSDIVAVQGETVKYRVVLEPQVSELKNSVRTQTYVNQTVPDIIRQKLNKIQGLNFQFRLTDTYEVREYVCQYQESDWNFINRWLQYYGMYYYFEQEEAHETMVIVDHQTAHRPSGIVPLIHCRQNLPEHISGGEKDLFLLYRVEKFATALSHQVNIQSYNPTIASTKIAPTAEIEPHGLGDVALYDEHAHTPDMAKRIAKIRSEEGVSHKVRVRANVYAPGLLPGELTQFEDCFNSADNQTYLVLENRQRIYQNPSFLGDFSGQFDPDAHYDQEITLLSQGVQYRPPRTYKSKRVSGVVLGKIDGPAGKQFPQLDDKGRYKVKLIHGDEPGGMNSCWVRKTSTFVGNIDGLSYGEHMPLHKDTEVLLGFSQGNVDYPIILGTLHNSDTPNVVNVNNHEQTVRADPAGNRHITGTTRGSTYHLFQSPQKHSTMSLGDNNAAADAASQSTNKSIPVDKTTNSNQGTWGNHFFTFGDLQQYMQNHYVAVHGASRTLNIGQQCSTTVGGDVGMTVGLIKASINVAAVVTSASMSALNYSKTRAYYKPGISKTRYLHDSKLANFLATEKMAVQAPEIRIFSHEPLPLTPRALNLGVKALASATAIGSAAPAAGQVLVSEVAAMSAAVTTAALGIGAENTLTEPLMGMKLFLEGINIQTSMLLPEPLTPGIQMRQDLMSILMAYNPTTYDYMPTPAIKMVPELMVISDGLGSKITITDSSISIRSDEISFTADASFTINAESISIDGVDITKEGGEENKMASSVSVQSVMSSHNAGSISVNASDINEENGLANDSVGERTTS